MALDKAIEHGKEQRKPYRKSKAIDSSCRNHGVCLWCKNNRLHRFRKREPFIEVGEIANALKGLPLRIYRIED